MLVAALSAAAEAAAKELEELNKKRDNLQRLHDADKVRRALKLVVVNNMKWGAITGETAFELYSGTTSSR